MAPNRTDPAKTNPGNRIKGNKKNKKKKNNKLRNDLVRLSHGNWNRRIGPSKDRVTQRGRELISLCTKLEVKTGFSQHDRCKTDQKCVCGFCFFLFLFLFLFLSNSLRIVY